MHFEFLVQRNPNTKEWQWGVRQDGASPRSLYPLGLDNLSQSAVEVTVRLQALEESFKDPAQVAAFRQMFANSNLMQEKEGASRPAWICFTAKGMDEEALKAAAIFYQGLYLYLRDGERYKTFHADLAYLTAAWQWYTAFARLLPQQPDPAELYNFGVAHQVLASMLEDPHFDLAAQWMPYFGRATGDLPLALARERMRTGMVLETIPPQEAKSRSLHLPIEAPGAFQPVRWEKTRILPVLSNNEGGKALVRRLISEWLLTRYDFSTPLHLARLLKHNQPQRELWQGGVMLGWLLVWVIAMLALNIAAQPHPGILAGPAATFWTIAAFCCGPLVLLGMALLWFEPGAVVNMALPRLSGGIALGYVAFILQKDAVELALRFLDPILALFLLWVGALLLGFAYLFFDVLPRGRSKKETVKRALVTLMAALLISMGMGLFMVALSTAAYNGCTGPGSCFLGPFGWVSLQQWASLVPLALFTGLVTQFVLEERTVTAPVWSSD